MTEHPLSPIAALDPQFVDHLRATETLVYSDGALPKKIKLLIALAFDAAHGASNGVRALAAAAQREGATKEEMVEAVRVAYHLGGVGGVHTAVLGLKEIAGDDLSICAG